MNDSHEISTYKGFDCVIREMIQQETATVNNRMNWLILLQGLLFAGYSNLSKNGYSSFIFAAMGIIVSFCMLKSFLSNEKAIRFILSKWDHFLEVNQTHHTKFPPVWAGAELLGNRFDKILVPHRFIPTIFMIAWLSIIINNVLINLGVIK
jgi:hypothetical protein